MAMETKRYLKSHKNQFAFSA